MNRHQNIKTAYNNNPGILGVWCLKFVSAVMFAICTKKVSQI